MAELKIWIWNCRGLNNKKSVLQQYVRGLEKKPDAILIQETLTASPKLPGYRVYAEPPEDGRRGVCVFVRKGLNSAEHPSKKDSKLEKQLIEILIGGKSRESVFLTNVYSGPKSAKQKFKNLLHWVTESAEGCTLVVGGDFNAAHRDLGHVWNSAKARDLFQDATDADLTLITDPSHPTHIGTSTTRDTTPDLVFTNETEAEWKNTGEDLGSDHYIVEVTVP